MQTQLVATEVFNIRGGFARLLTGADTPTWPDVQAIAALVQDTDLLAGVGPDHAGYSTWFGYCNDSRIDIRVTKQYWENYTDVQRLYLMYHELGHDVHRYEHVTVDPIEIMWPSIAGPLTTLNDFIAAKDRFIMRTFEDINYIQCD